MSLHLWLLLTGTAFIASIVPGPAVLYGLTCGAVYGKRTAVAAAIGISTSALLMTLIASAGLGVMLKTSGQLFLVVKYVGAGYLLILGIKMLFSQSKTSSEQSSAHLTSRDPGRKLFIRSFLIGMSNPKAIIFNTALVPQFIDVTMPQWPQLLCISVTIAVTAFISMIVYIAGGHSLSGKITTAKAVKRLNKMTGGLFVGFSIKLAISN